jgi:SOS-response transcriptional repressor LexA
MPWNEHSVHGHSELFVHSVNQKLNMPEQFVQRIGVAALALGLKSKEKIAKELGVSRTTLHYYETGAVQPNEQFFQSLARFEEKARTQGTHNVQPLSLGEDPLPYRVRGMRKVPIVSWAHAGSAVTYEELPTHWQNSITSECRDPNAFAVVLEGDSMRSTNPGLSFEPGDYIVAQPSEQAYSGCFVVAKFVNDGIIFRRFETTGDKIRLVPLNERYPLSEHSKEEFHWIYPVFARVTHLWSR